MRIWGIFQGSILRFRVKKQVPHSNERKVITMIGLAILFLIIAIVAAIFGFFGIVSALVGVAKVLFFVFLILFILSLIFGRRRSS